MSSWWKTAQQMRQRPPLPQIMNNPSVAQQAQQKQQAAQPKWTNVVMNNGQWKFYAANGQLVGGPTNNFQQFANQADTRYDVVRQKLESIQNDITAYRSNAAGKSPQEQSKLFQTTFGKYSDQEYLPQNAPAAPQQNATTPSSTPSGQSFNSNQFEKSQTSPDGTYEARPDGRGGVSLFAPNSQVPYANIPASQLSTPANQEYIKKMTGKAYTPPAASTPAPTTQASDPKPTAAPASAMPKV